MVRGWAPHNMVVEDRRRCRRMSGRVVPMSPRINISLINFGAAKALWRMTSRNCPVLDS
jgi:hypothetical protein